MWAVLDTTLLSIDFIQNHRGYCHTKYVVVILIAGMTRYCSLLSKGDCSGDMMIINSLSTALCYLCHHYC